MAGTDDLGAGSTELGSSGSEMDGVEVERSPPPRETGGTMRTGPVDGGAVCAP